VWSCFDISTFKIIKYHSNYFEQLNVTKTKLSPILNKYWPWTEGDACLFHSVVDVLFFPSIDKHWKFPLWFLLFSSISPKSACPNQALRRLWRFCRFSKFLRTRGVYCALRTLRCWQILTAKSIHFRKNLSCATHALSSKLIGRLIVLFEREYHYNNSRTRKIFLHQGKLWSK